MALRRSWAFCMAVLTVFFVIACIPPVPVFTAGAHSSDGPLPLSLACPVGDRMYFLPPYDEVAGFNPVRRLYVLPTVIESDEIQDLSGFFEVCVVRGQVPDLCGIESITPRAP